MYFVLQVMCSSLIVVFLNGEGAGLGDPKFSRENFGPFKSHSILIASGTSLRSGSSF